MKTLYGKLVAVLLGLLVFIAAIGIFFSLYIGQLHDQEISQRLSKDLAANLVKEDVLLGEGGINESALEHVFHTLMIVNPSIEVYLLDLEGHIVAFSAPTGKVKLDEVSITPIKVFLDGKEALPIRGDDPRNPGRTKVFSASPIMVEDRYEGYLYVVLASEEYDSVVQLLRTSQLVRLGLGALGASLLVALMAGVVLFNLMTRRLRRLSAAMDDFRRSDFSAPLTANTREDDRSEDEIGRLGRTFDSMAERILQQVQRLKQNDELRRELIANVSHELRTPLASMKGYLETLSLKQDSISAEERREYLEIASKHSDRLSRLVEELFDLARLESKEMKAQPEPFPIAELVQDVAQEFQLRAQRGKVLLEARLPEDLPFVSADIALIQRALQNLIENALKHTEEGGRVTIVLERDGGQVIVRVEDTGCGIPDDDLKQIFERFYQAEGGIGKDQERAPGGLGLAIVKKILELHGSAVRAASTVGEAPGGALTCRAPCTAARLFGCAANVARIHRLESWPSMYDGQAAASTPDKA